jgi:hypothetical protein
MTRQGSLLCRHREHRLGDGEFGRQDRLDVVVEHLGVDRRRALVLAVDELVGPYGMIGLEKVELSKAAMIFARSVDAARSSASATSRTAL